MEKLAEKIMLFWGWRRAALAFFAGVLSVLALPPVNFFAIMFVTMPALVWLLDGATGSGDERILGRLRPAFFTGWWFGFGYFLGGLWWLGSALLVEADQFAWALPLAVVGLPAVLAIYYGLATAVARLFWTDGVGRIAALAAAFGLAEYAREFLFTGFPWNAIGTTIMPVPLMMQPVRLVGLEGMNVAAVFVFAAPALLVTRRGRWPGLALATLMLAAQLGYGGYRFAMTPEMPPDSDTAIVRIVQPGTNQAANWGPGDQQAIFNALLDLTAKPPSDDLRRPDFIVWPETAIPFLLTDNPGALVEIADKLDIGQTLIAGAVRMEDGQGGEAARFYNTIYAIDDSGEIIASADKAHLVPFGEYLPFEGLLSRMGLKTITQAFGGFSPAFVRSEIKLPGGLNAIPLVCYEAIFPALVEAEGGNGNLLINLTNDAWFGLTPGPYQHLAQAKLRAVETGLPMIRAANTGISAIIDGAGRITAFLPLTGVGEASFLDAKLPLPVKNPLTYMQRQLNFWLFFGFMCCICLAVRLMASFRRE